MIDLTAIKKRYPFNESEDLWQVIALAEQLQSENSALKAELEKTTENAIRVLSGRCKGSCQKEYTSFDSFIQNGGGDCPICLKNELNQLKAEIEYFKEVDEDTTIEAIQPIVNELETLKAHNRKLVEAIQSHGCILNAESENGCHLCDLVFSPPSFAKLALAEAEVLRAAEEWHKQDLLIRYFQPEASSQAWDIAEEKLHSAVEAMQEAKGDA